MLIFDQGIISNDCYDDQFGWQHNSFIYSIWGDENVCGIIDANDAPTHIFSTVSYLVI